MTEPHDADDASQEQEDVEPAFDIDLPPEEQGSAEAGSEPSG